MGARKWQDWTEKEENLAVLRAWKMAGLSDEEIAKRVGVSRSTLSEWKKKYERIRDALSSGKEFADSLVENSLFKLTQGFKVEVRKVFKVKKVEFDEKGRRIGEKEELETALEDEYVKPDVRAMVFWLQNRKPEVWRKMEEKAEPESTGGILVLTPAEMERIKEDVREDAAERNGKGSDGGPAGV